jgi:DnaJ like chaperone protein
MKLIIGLAIIAFGVFLEVMWLGFCFGTVVVGILLLLFAPAVLFFPFNFFLAVGLAVLTGREYTQSANFNYKEYANYGPQGNSYVKAKNSLDAYYETLESSKTDSLETIKSNYRRLIKEYHYDSIASKNLPEDMVKFAKEKTQSLNEAYSAIKDSRG